MSFQIHALPETLFSQYFEYDKHKLNLSNAHLEIVTENHSIPCRVSLSYAKVGEIVLLVNYQHQPKNTPYKSTHAIFVRKDVRQANLVVNEVPNILTTSVLSIRGFDCRHFIKQAVVIEGLKLAETLETIFDCAEISYIHIHFAGAGCFTAKATRT